MVVIALRKSILVSSTNHATKSLTGDIWDTLINKVDHAFNTVYARRFVEIEDIFNVMNRRNHR